MNGISLVFEVVEPILTLGQEAEDPLTLIGAKHRVKIVDHCFCGLFLLRVIQFGPDVVIMGVNAVFRHCKSNRVVLLLTFGYVQSRIVFGVMLEIQTTIWLYRYLWEVLKIMENYIILQKSAHNLILHLGVLLSSLSAFLNHDLHLLPNLVILLDKVLDI